MKQRAWISNDGSEFCGEKSAGPGDPRPQVWDCAAEIGNSNVEAFHVEVHKATGPFDIAKITVTVKYQRSTKLYNKVSCNKSGPWKYSN